MLGQMRAVLWLQYLACGVLATDSERLLKGRIDENMLLQLQASPEISKVDTLYDIDLVVERHCEDLAWLGRISKDLRPRLKVFIYDKPGTSCERLLAKDIPTDLHVTVEVLENVGRDGHDQLYHISTHYQDLARHTVFVQAGLHAALQGMLYPRTSGWDSQEEALNDLLPKLSEEVRFLPLSMYTVRGPVLWQDREDDTDPDIFPEVNVLKFKTGAADMFNKAREMYSILFGGKPCDSKGQWFTPGMQYIVHRDSIRRRPLTFWNAFRQELLSCEPQFGYVFERLTTAIYNSSVVTLDPSTWHKATYCQRHNIDWSSFTDPLDVIETAKFWRKHWGCEPLSERLLQMHAKGQI